MAEGAKSGTSSAPGGVGATPGLGEAFNINLNTGQGMYSLQLPLPPGVAGHSPSLALDYAHGQGHGAFGFGWRLRLRSLVRRLDAGDQTEQVLDAGTELVPVGGGAYGALVESAHTRYRRDGDGWRIEERNGVVHSLGLTPAARVASPQDPRRVYEWLLDQSTDPMGNAITYRYELDQGWPYLVELRYAAYAVRLEYEGRPDPRSDGRYGFLRRLARRASAIQLVLDPGSAERIIRSWTLRYDEAPWSGISLLSSVQLQSHGPAADGSEDVTRRPVRFGYASFRPDVHRVYWMSARAGPEPPPLTDPDVALVNMDRSPLPGVLQLLNGRQWYWQNRGDGEWEPATPLRRVPPITSFARDGLAFVDMDASGTGDLLVAADEPLPGYYRNDGTDGWGGFVAFPRGRRAAPNWSTLGLRLADADGDGRIDALRTTRRGLALWRNEGEQGWAEPAFVPQAVELPDLADPLVHLADMTGDGALDLVRLGSGRVEYWPSLGQGRYAEPVVMRSSPRLPYLHRHPESHLLVDVDGDGCADLVRVSHDGITMYANQSGQAFDTATQVPDVPPPIPGTLRAVNLSGRLGSGLVWNARTARGNGYVAFDFEGAVPYLLTEVDNGAGLLSKILYRSAVVDWRRDRDAGERWTTNFPFPYLVVGGTREIDSVSGRRTDVDFLYHEAHFSPDLRQFQGFRRAERLERGDASRADTLQRMHFLMAQEREPGHGPRHAALNGLLWRSEVFGLDGTADEGKPFRIEESDYDLRELATLPDGRQRVELHVSATRSHDLERGADVRTEEKTFTYDATGRVVREAHRAYGTRSGVAQPQHRQVTELSYAASAARHMLDHVSRIVVRDDAGKLLSETRRYYDGPDFLGLPFGQADRGLVTREEQLVLSKAEFDVHYAGMDPVPLGFVAALDADGQAALFAQTRRAAYDARGLRIAAQDELGNTTRFHFEARGLFRTELSEPLGLTRFEVDPALGQVTKISYADGTEARFAFDAQGRVTAAALPGEALADARRRFVYDDRTIPASRTSLFRFANGPGGVAQVVTYFDGSGSEVQQRVETRDQKYVVSAWQVRNPWGHASRELEPFLADDALFAVPDPAGTAHRDFFYDARGRVLRTVNFNDAVSTATYHPFEVITSDGSDNDASPPNLAAGRFGTPRHEHFDALRHRTAVVRDLGGGSTATTRYVTTLDGQVLEIADDQGVQSRFTYDRRGSRLRIEHRDAGTRRLWTDARRLIVRTVDGNGNDLRGTLDWRGRLVRLSANGQEIETYRYDDLARHALGRLAEVTYIGGSQRFAYSPAGSLLRQEHRFEGVAGSYEVQFEYDLLGRQTGTVHPDGTRIAQELTPNGWVRAVTGFVDNVDYDARGLPVRLAYHNGITTEFTYSAGPGRVRTRRTSNAAGQLLEDVTYDYDALEMLLGRDDQAPGGAGPQSFTYDALNQIATMTSVENGAPVTRRYDYAGHHNLGRFEETGAVVHFDDAAHPDRAAGLTPGGGARMTLRYDGNGNLLGLPGRDFRYSVKNELSQVSGPRRLRSEYRYDHEGNRVSKTVTTGAGQVTRTTFVGNLVEIRQGRPTYFVHLANLRVAILYNGNTRYVHGDDLGSSTYFTDGAGTKIAVIAYRPYGNIASSSGVIDLRTFASHPFDAESGLFYMRKRYYAPELGRFVTADPLAVYQPERFLGNPKGLHPFVYALNDPLNTIDPTGLSFWSVLGAIVGVIVGVIAAIAVVALTIMTAGAFGLLVGALVGLGLAVGAVGVMAVCYVIASANAGTPFGEFMRGFLIGFNAGMNAVLASTIFGPVVGVALGVINFLASIDEVARNPVYQGILGWSSWLMPMSWLATAFGLMFFVINVVMAFFTVTFPGWFGSSGWAAARIDSVAVDWGTGTIVMSGGLIQPMGGSQGFNLGNFVFLTSGQGGNASLIRHETGHTLNVAAYGFLFHIINIFDENWPFNQGANAFAEKVADSHDPGSSHPKIPQWGV
jgi:RHS repeat-associated protein